MSDMFDAIRQWFSFLDDDSSKLDMLQEDVSDLEAELTSHIQWQEQRWEERRSTENAMITALDSNRKAIENILSFMEDIESYLEEKDSERSNELLERVKKLERMVGREDSGFKSPENAGVEGVRTSERHPQRHGRMDQVEETAEEAVAGEKLWETTTKAQREVLQAMYDSGYPVSYREIAEKLDKSVSTVKNHINNLKAKGVSFTEERGPNNAKRFGLDTRLTSYITIRLNS